MSEAFVGEIISELQQPAQTEQPKENMSDKNEPLYTFIFYQMLVAVCLLILIILFKLFGGRFYGYTRQAYIDTFDTSLSVTEITKAVKDVFSNDISQTETVNFPRLLDSYVKEVKQTSNLHMSIIESQPESTVYNSLCWPVIGKITDKFGLRDDPFNTKQNDTHNGIDIAADIGTDVRSAMSGFVNISRYDSTYGNYIVITHSDGIKTLYAHLDERLVDVGQTVQKGEVIARSGNTGNSTGPHLHFEILMGGTTRIDPLTLLPDE